MDIHDLPVVLDLAGIWRSNPSLDFLCEPLPARCLGARGASRGCLDGQLQVAGSARADSYVLSYILDEEVQNSFQFWL